MSAYLSALGPESFQGRAKALSPGLSAAPSSTLGLQHQVHACGIRNRFVMVSTCPASTLPSHGNNASPHCLWSWWDHPSMWTLPQHNGEEGPGTSDSQMLLRIGIVVKMTQRERQWLVLIYPRHGTLKQLLP